MRYFLTVLFVVSGLAAAGQQNETKFSIRFPSLALEAALKLIEQQTGIPISYEYTRVHGITIKARIYKEASPEMMIADLLKGTRLTFKRRGDQIFIGPGTSATHTLSGYVEDAASGERLIGVSLVAPQYQAGTVTNAYGFYSLTLPADTVRVQVSYLGYQRLDTLVAMQDTRSFSFRLTTLSSQLGEVTIRGTRADNIETSSQMSRIHLPAALVQSAPRLLGEADLFKTLQLMPGVKQGTEATSALLVRGGTPDQNLILLDGAPLYNPVHLMGIFSTFNTSVLKDVTLYKGAFPARYGGRLSSVVDISTKDGDMYKIHGNFSVGLLSAQATLDGPIKKEKTTFVLSARRSYPDLAARLYLDSQDNSPDKFRLNFYDINAKVHHRFSDRDKLYLSFYTGRDKLATSDRYGHAYPFYYVTDVGVNWGNYTGTLRWNHVYSPKLFSNVMLIGSDYRFQSVYKQAGATTSGTYSDEQRLNSGIRDYGGRIDVEYQPKPAHTVKAGTQLMYRLFTPGVLQTKQTEKDKVVADSSNSNHNIHAQELSLYAEDDWQLSQRMSINAGLHFSGFNVEKRLYLSLQPRVSARYLLPANWALKASYTRMTQYIHLLAYNSISLPADLWVPATDKIRPQDADQYALGVARNLFGDQLEFSAEAYYKRMYHVIEYKEGASYLTSVKGDSWQEQVAAEEGKSYGLELLLQKKSGRLTGWAGYTLAWANRQLPEVNYGRTFPYKYDRRHDVHLVAVYKWRKGITLSASWTYQSAAPFTIPLASYGGLTDPLSEGGLFRYSRKIDYVNSRNNVRIKAYHRLDLGVSFVKHKKNGLVRTWNISLLNVYNRFNPYFYYVDSYSPVQAQATLTALSLVPFLPGITYELKF
ncbi:TonB-dependent Receptor Plug Domain [Chitinophaga eiseniae]|uniref:TonB-dependent Receptor Plug Domain n=1 Tax=Chitinophaga eiseniae TaxID=634771 RepID=A0A1T4T6F3_9BACT|nr:TonB-dependent receptor [Chitinophaga eiseniae]SKA36042.1 TonB-dependent Receptor Plug Domain [Chitinophaga eiseniae]